MTTNGIHLSLRHIVITVWIEIPTDGFFGDFYRDFMVNCANIKLNRDLVQVNWRTIWKTHLQRKNWCCIEFFIYIKLMSRTWAFTLRFQSKNNMYEEFQYIAWHPAISYALKFKNWIHHLCSCDTLHCHYRRFDKN